MSKKYNVIVRLYRHTDLDLMALLDTEGFSLQLFTKTVLKSYADKKVYYVDVPKPDKISENERVKNERTYIVYFDTETDSEVIKLFQGIKNRYRNGFIKNVVRKYIFGSSLSCFFEDENLEREYLNLQRQLGVPVIDYKRVMQIKVHTMPDSLLSSDAIRLEPKDAPLTAVEDNYENTRNIIPQQQINDIINKSDEIIVNKEKFITKEETDKTTTSEAKEMSEQNSEEDAFEIDFSDTTLQVENMTEEEEAEFEDFFDALG